MSENTHDSIGERNESNREDIPNGSSENKMDEVSRRKFLTMLLGMTGTAIAATLATPLASYALSPAMKKEKVDWVAIGNLADFKSGEPIKVEYSFKRKDGWIESEVKQTCWVVKKDDSNLKVLSPNCTHLGCGYQWDSGTQQFKCPCHGGVYTIDGEVVAGPPPRPLDQFETKTENGKLFVGKLKQVEG